MPEVDRDCGNFDGRHREAIRELKIELKRIEESAHVSQGEGICEEPTAGTSSTSEGKDTRVDAGEKTGDRGCFWLGMRNGFEKKNNGGIDQYGYAVQERSRTAREEHEQRSIF